MPMPTAEMTAQIKDSFRTNILPGIQQEEREKLRLTLIKQLIRYRDISAEGEKEKLLDIINHFIR